MRILSIETSADETAISIVDAKGVFPNASYEVLGNALASQTKTHTRYGGIVPSIAKREHAKILIPLLETALQEASLLSNTPTDVSTEEKRKIATVLAREPDLTDTFFDFFSHHSLPPIDFIAVTSGPGLEPALWVGVNFARALSSLGNYPVIPVNHMEGHVLASIYDVVEDNQLAQITFPAIALLISGGHTELDLMHSWSQYECVGRTRDDAVGEAFDKVARMLGLPYPGGPEISKLASRAREDTLPPFPTPLPKPMLHSGDLDLSFSGLKTAVRYAIEGKQISLDERDALARDFEDVITEVLLKKSQAALTRYGSQTLIVGGGVSANTFIRRTFETALLSSHPDVTVYFPQKGLSTDNSLMIALAGHARIESARTAGSIDLIKADGNRSLG